MFSALQLAFSLGLLIALPLVLCTVLGVWLDTHMNTTPVFIIGCTIFGMIFTIVLMIKKLLPFLEKRSKKLI